MKRYLSIILSVLLVLSLCACGGGGTATEVPAAAEAPATEAPATDAPAPEAPAEEPAGVDFPEMTLTFACGSSEIETQAQFIKQFVSYVEEATGGAVTINVFYGGTIVSDDEALEMLSNGGIDMMITFHVGYTNELPLLNFPGSVIGTADEVLGYANYIMFENPETSAIIEAEAAKWNAKYLNVNFSGPNAFVGVKEFSSLNDLRGQKVGHPDTAVFIAAGMNALTIIPPDIYESLSRGVCDFSQMSIDAIYALKWYEVAPYLMLDGLSNFGNIFTINLNVWNSMTPELQQVFSDAAAEVSKSWVDFIDVAIDEYIAEMEATGATVGSLSEADQQEWFDIYANFNFDNMMARAEAQGITADAEVIQRVAKEYLGLD